MDNGAGSSLFELDGVHDLLRDVVEKVCADTASSSAGGDWPGATWQKFAELDVLGAPLPEDRYGGGGGPLELMTIMHAVGKQLASVPFIATIAIAGQLLARAGSPDQVQDRLRRIVDGQLTVAFCGLEEGDRGMVAGLRTTATPDGRGYRLSGHKSVVQGAHWCDTALVVAELAPAPGRYGAFFVSTDAPGLSCDHRKTIDGQDAAEIRLDDVFVGPDDCIGTPDGANEHIEYVYDLAVVGLCAQACGHVEAMFRSTVDYVTTREQFGQPIGKFQVVRHRVVDMGGRLEQATAITHWAAANFGHSAAVRRRAIAAAKAYVGRASRAVAQQAVQLHGAIGITDELALSQHLRGIEVFNACFGTSSDHVGRYIATASTTPLGAWGDEATAPDQGLSVGSDAR